MKKIATWGPRILLSLAMIALLYLLARAVWLYLDYMRILIAFPFNADYGEGPILDQVMRLSRGESIYPVDISQSPFIIGNYPPLYHLLQLPFAWIFGPAFWYGRTINLICILASAYFIGASLYFVTKNQFASILSAALLPTIPFILHWSGFVRIDSLALALSWAALFVIITRREHRRALVLTAVLLTLAIFTRQSYGLAAPFAAFIWLLSHKPRRRAFELALWTGGFSLAIFLLLNLITRGGFFFNIVTANVNPFFWDSVEDYLDKIWKNMGLLVVLSAAYLVLAGWFKQKVWWVVAPYLVASTLSAVTIGKDGSNVNYLYEFSAALAFTAGAFLAWLGPFIQEKRIVTRLWGLKLALLVAMALQVNEVYHWCKNDYLWPTDRAQFEYAEIAEMASLVAASDLPVLADEFMGLLPISGKPLVFQPFEYKQLAAGEIWDQTPFIDAVYQKQYGLILLNDSPFWDSQGNRWTPQQLAAIRGNYKQVDRLADTIIYVPSEPLDFAP